MANRGLPAHLIPMLETLRLRRALAPGSLKGSDSMPELPMAAGGIVMPENAPTVGLKSAVPGQPGVFALVAGEAVLVLAANPNRQLLIVSNLGTAIAYVHFDNPQNGVIGVPLVGGATMFCDVKCPSNPVSGYSALGTALYVYEG